MIALAVALFAPWLAVAANPEVASAADKTTRTPLDEVVIQAQREKLSKLRMQIEEQQQRFFAAYNEVNGEREFRVTCSEKAGSNTKIQHLECQPQFVLDAQEEEAKGFLDGALFNSGAVTQTGGGSEVISSSGGDTVGVTTVVSARLMQQQDAFYRHVLAIVKGNEKLSRMLLDHAELQRRYKEARKVKLRGRWFVWD